MLDIRRIFARQHQAAVAAVAVDAVALVPADVASTAPAVDAFLASWPGSAGPFFTADGQSAVTLAALLHSAEFQIEDVA